jgi:hypothetical protein
MSNECLRFIPSRVEGVDEVTEVAVFPDRLELWTATGPRTFCFIEMAEWPRPAWLWRLLFKLGVRPRCLLVADRDWFHKPADRFFSFYTEPRLVVRMPEQEPAGPYGETFFVRMRQVIHSGGFHTYDLG